MQFFNNFDGFRFAMHVIAVFALFVCIVNACSKHKVIETNNGKVRGVRKTTLIQKLDFYSFKGIPYAKSPTGELRFKVKFLFLIWKKVENCILK